MKQPPAFQFYPADFLADGNVMAMGMAERGIYVTLLCICWREGSLPNDVGVLASYCGMSPQEFEPSWERVRRCFRVSGKRLRHKRLDEERRKQKDRKLRFSEAGRRGAKARWKRTDADPVSTPIPTRGIEEPESSSEKPSDDGDSDGDAMRMDGSSSSSSSSSSVRTSTARNRAGRIPKDFSPNSTHERIAREMGLDLEYEATQFRDHAAATGRLLKDWDAGLRVWLRKARRNGRPARKAKPDTSHQGTHHVEG